METLLQLADIFLPLPDDKQKEILDFAEFLSKKYAKEITQEENQINIEPSEELKILLKKRLQQHRDNPKAARKWDDVKKELLQKYA